MRPAMTIIVGFLLAAIAPGLSAQTKPAATPQQKPATQTATKPAAGAPAQQKPATQNAAKPAAAAPQKPAAAKPGAPGAQKPAAKPAAKTASTKSAKKPATPTRAAGTKKPTDTEPAKIARRDPFESLVARQAAAARNAAVLPPGKAGLQVSTLRVDGIVKASNGMIAVVTNPQSRTYFLREGDRLYDGSVEKISMDGVTFHEEGKDAFGKPVERQVNKRIYSIAGEQQ